MDMKDNGTIQQFAGGALREGKKGKGRPELVSPFSEAAMWKWLEEGAARRGDRNWEKGIPFSSAIAGLKRHTQALQLGLTDEDHESGVWFNAMIIKHGRKMIKEGLWSRSLDDLPRYSVEGQPLRIYVGGPFTSATNEGRAYNIANAEEVCRQLMAKGHLVHCPHAATGFFNNDDHYFEYNRFMELDFSLLDHWATAFFYIAPSPGTDRELAVATANGLMIYRNVEDVPTCEVTGRFPLGR